MKRREGERKKKKRFGLFCLLLRTAPAVAAQSMHSSFPKQIRIYKSTFVKYTNGYIPKTATSMYRTN
jgi:hypothetical protein